MIEKNLNFSFNHKDQQDKIYSVMTSQQVKENYDSRGEDLKAYVYSIIDELLNSTGSQNIGYKTGNVYQELDKKTQDILSNTAAIQQTNANLDSTNNNLYSFEQRYNSQIINAGNSNAEIVDARSSYNGDTFPSLKDRLDLTDKNLYGMVNLKSLGAKMDGVTDDSDILNQALAQYAKIFIPDGRIYIGKTIVTNEKNMIVGCGNKTIIRTDKNINLFNIAYGVIMYDFSIELFNGGVDYTSNIFNVNELTLKTIPSGTSSADISIHDINIDSYIGGVGSSVICTSISNNVITSTGSVDGYNNINFYNIFFNGNHSQEKHFSFFCKNYCKNNKWITGLNIKDIFSIGTVWGFFDGENDIDLNDISVTSNAGMNLYNCQIQHCKAFSKACIYFRSGTKNLTCCTSWDWSYNQLGYKAYLVNKAFNQKIYMSSMRISPSEVQYIDSANVKTDAQYTLTEFKNLFVTQEIPATDLREKIIGLGKYPLSVSTHKATLIYKSASPIITSSGSIIMFSFLDIASMSDWSKIRIFTDTSTSTLKYTSTIDLPYYMRLYYYVNGSNYEIYIGIASANLSNRGMSQYHVGKLEPLVNLNVTYGDNYSYCNFIKTLNVFNFTSLSELPTGFVEIEKLATSTLSTYSEVI